MIMATFKVMIKKENKRKDGTWNVVIRFTHGGVVRFIPTTMYVTKKDITPSFKIKNGSVIDRANELIKVFRERVNELSLELNDMGIDAIVKYIRTKKDNKGISFTDFARKWIIDHTEIKGVKNYNTAINALCSFFGRENILCEEVNVDTMKAFEKSLDGRPRAQSLYPNSIKRIFNEARNYYNDEDNGIIRIKHTLNRYNATKQNIAQKRALTTEQIRNIFSLHCNGKSRRDLALDCFKMSFALMGMNSADLFNAINFDGKTITYNRTKTRGRRNDSALIQVDVHPCISEIVSKYRDKDNKRVFSFYHRYSTFGDFNRAINIGLKDIGNEIGIDRLQFYAARHSMATIAVNECGISKYIVNDMLNHTDESLRITELYIKKDFKAINEANAKLLAYILE